MPPVIKEGMISLIRKLEGNRLNRWKMTPIDTCLHYLGNFNNCKAKKYWLQLKAEVRPGIIIGSKIGFSVNYENSNYEFLQLGFGARKVSSKNSIKIFINDVLSGNIENLSDDGWHDLRLKIEKAKNEINIRIEQSGIKKLYVSHPVFIRKKEPNRTTPPKKPNNIICLIYDSINFEMFKLCGREASPNLHEFFKNGMSCNQAFTQADWTLPAFSSMLTGLHVSRHGTYHPGPNDFFLKDTIPTLPELLLKQGYRTYGYSTHNRFSPAYGHAKGFERFMFKPFSNEFSYSAIQDVIFHLEAHKTDPNFLLMHVFDVHPPYKPSSYLKECSMKTFRDDSLFGKGGGEKYDFRLSNMKDELEAKLKEFDTSISNLFSYLEKNNMIDDTLVIFTADHGTSFTIDYGLSNGHKEKPRLIDERIHVPLLIRGPNIPKGEENSLIGCSVDLMPSILHYANIDIPENIDGRIWPFIGGKGRDKVLSESLYRNKYSAVLKDNENCHHLLYPCDLDNRSINFKKRNPIVSYRRENFFDIEEDISIGEKKMLEIYNELENMHFSSEKYFN